MTTTSRPPAKPAQRENRMTLAAVHRGTREAPDRILLVGVEGIGKSTFGANAPNPIFLAAEDGIRHLDTASFPEPKTYLDVLDAIQTLATSEHPYRTLVVDTLDWLEPLIAAHVCERNGWADPEVPGYGKGWVAVTAEWRNLLLALDRLRIAKGMEIILLAHATLRNVTNPSGPDYSRYEGKLNKGALALVKEWTDTNLFAIHEEFVQKGKGELKAKVSSSGRRIMHTERGAGWDAKNRHNLPPVLALDYAEYAAARAAGRPAAPESLDAQARELVAALSADEATKTKYLAKIDAAKGDAAALAKAVDYLKTKVAEKESS
jgi:hypothetical protein